MRMMKCYLANTGSRHFITSDEAATGEPGSLTCPSCGCVLYFQHGSADEKPWFWHDQSTVPVSTLMAAFILIRKLKQKLGSESCEILLVN